MHARDIGDFKGGFMKQSQKQALRMAAGDLSGLYGIRDYTINDGKGRGMRAYELRNGRGLEMTVLPDRCLDIPYFSYKGINLGVVTKAGLCSPFLYVEDEARGFLKQFNAGLLTTCGLTYAGAPGEVDGRKYGLHGNIGNTPAEGVNACETVKSDDIFLKVSGSVREACVFGEHLVLLRELLMDTEHNVIYITDTVENRGFEPYPVMNLYHINFGYPLLDDGAKIYFSTPKVEPRNEEAAKGMNVYNIVEKPEICREEQCYIHTGGKGFEFGMLHNPKLGLAAVVHYDSQELPLFNEWKCMRAGEYALGLEPSASGFWGQKYAREHGYVKDLGPGESRTFSMRVEVLDDLGAIEEYSSRCKENK
jgi:hypothetical protein